MQNEFVFGDERTGPKSKTYRALFSGVFFFCFFLDIFILFKWDCDPIYEYGGPTIYTLLVLEGRGWSILYLAHFEATSVTSG